MDNSVSAKSSSRTYWTTDDIKSKIEKNRVVIFSKGNAEHPKDGFSERALTAIKSTGKPYDVVDVSEDSSILAALRAFAGRATLPMVYVEGDLVANSETIQRSVDSGELQSKVCGTFVQH